MNDNDWLILAILGTLDPEIIVDKILSCFMDEGQVAAKFGVSIATVQVWYEMGKLKGFRVGSSLLFLKDVADPRTSQ